MDTHVPTTPFGQRPLSLSMVASQSIAKECPSGIFVHKWQIFRAISEARQDIGISERALTVLEALISFHPETVLTAAQGLTVFPSNYQLTLRAHGMPVSTLRRHIAVLVHAGLIVRRDSPNGKRYRRRDHKGDGGQAFGFDLTPLLARAAEFQASAQAVRDERQTATRLRERITLARRDLRKIFATGVEEGVPADWEAKQEVYASIVGRLPRRPLSSDLAKTAEQLTTLKMEALMLLEEWLKSQKAASNGSSDERHIQNSNTKQILDLEPVLRISRAASLNSIPNSVSQRRSLLLPAIIQACPDIVDYSRGGISTWQDLVAAADAARGALGVSPSAYEEAQATLGRNDAAIVVAAILQKGSAVNNAGAYLRALTAKGKEEKFSPGPMIMALLKTRVRVRETPAVALTAAGACGSLSREAFDLAFGSTRGRDARAPSPYTGSKPACSK